MPMKSWVATENILTVLLEKYEETFKNLEYPHEESSWINLAGFNVIIVNPLGKGSIKNPSSFYY